MKIDILDKNCEFQYLKQNKEIIDNNKKNEEQSTTNSDKPEKKLLKDKNYMISILKQKYPSFLETFELEEYINSGSTGVVYGGKSKKVKKKQKIAFKFKIGDYKKDNSNNQEISILRKLHHKNITEIYAFLKMNDNYSNVCALELAKHGDLENFQKVLLKRKVLSETILNYFTKQILDSLEYIHRCKIIHLDIKQGNILVDSNLNIKLTDFSVSCSYSEFHPEDVIKFPYVGTSKYMSPEIIGRTEMEIKDAEKVDLYSLGVTLYNLAFGEYPYDLSEVGSKDYDTILENIKSKTLDFPKDRKISNLFKDFLRGLLEKDYTKRFNIRKALNHPWIQASQTIFDEKEKVCCPENFLINLVTDNIIKFNNIIKLNNNV
jgi:serine/threonine protein kinase